MNRSEAIAIEVELQERLLQATLPLVARLDGTRVKIEENYVHQLYYCRSNA